MEFSYTTFNSKAFSLFKVTFPSLKFKITEKKTICSCKIWTVKNF